MVVESEPVWLVAELADEAHDYGPRYAGDGGQDPALDPGGSAFVRFASGAVVSVHIDKAAPPHFEIALVGESGAIRVRGSEPAEVRALGDSDAIVRLESSRPVIGDTQAAIVELLGRLDGSPESTSDGRDVLRALSILVGILQSATLGSRPVSFPLEDR